MGNEANMNSGKADLYMVEDFQPGSVKPGDRVVAISPEAAYDLDKEGMEYSIAEDYYPAEELFEGEENYFREQLEWFGSFDSLLREKILYCALENVDLATAHYYRVKCFVDALVIYARTFAKLLYKSETSEILYFRKRGVGFSKSFYAPFDAQKTVLCALVSLLASHRGIRFSVSEVPVYPKKQAGQVFSAENAKDKLKKFHVRSALRVIKYEKWKALFLKKKEVEPINILSLHAGTMGNDELMKDVISSGGKVFLKEGRRILSINDLFERDSLDMGDLGCQDESMNVREALKEVLDDFMQDRALAGWINDKCGVDVSDIIKPYFEDLILNVIFENLMELPVLKEFLAREEIDFVVSRSSSEKESVSSLLAAADGGKRVCMQHACGAYECKHDHITDLAFFDYYFAMHGDAEDQAKSICANSSYIAGCEIHQAPWQMLNLFGRYRNNERDPSLVLYIPSKLFLGFRCFNGMRYSVEWYYKFQKFLIDFFVSRKNFKFIFKHATGQLWAENSILRYIREKHCRNIYIETRPLSECLGKAGRAFTDYPSTSFYEAVASGIPVMSLYPRELKIMPQSEKLFGRSLREFKDIRGAISAVDEFLSADPSAYMVDIPMRETDVVEVLREIKTGRMSMASENLV